jgi:hypothetical protein
VRQESGNPQLYAGFEWLAAREPAVQARIAAAPPGEPLGRAPPTDDDRRVFATFQQIWSTPRDAEARLFFAALPARVHSYAEFRREVPLGSPAWTRFDRILCAYDQAGSLIKRGILHPALFFAAWDSPAHVWQISGDWLKQHRVEHAAPEVYGDFDWLVAFETKWKASPKP